MIRHERGGRNEGALRPPLAVLERARLELDLADLVGAGFHSFAEKDTPGPAVEVLVVDRREKYAACARSWKRRPDVGSDAEFPDLTLRDALAVRAMRKRA